MRTAEEIAHDLVMRNLQTIWKDFDGYALRDEIAKVITSERERYSQKLTQLLQHLEYIRHGGCGFTECQTMLVARQRCCDSCIARFAISEMDGVPND